MTWRKIVICARFGGQQLSEIMSWPVPVLDRFHDEIVAFEKEFRGVEED